ncbi:DUF4395 domain-containing protein [Carboxylicivirga linearis]|uniref:DUF4395 domain-containing protein n=1 Tax=Carboxylicivirga linearis TaxID=1628157 RepID=A0ABS5JZD6_9BACT|nr:DUF4395 domain-containing protein [Carboxylicivirga linearis]MBS2100274.1 DUF4395 domain-containing protein [Carboxylicivirga linearis]
MKNVVCPVSPDRILEAQPRISALFVVVLLTIYLLTQLWLIPAFLFVDFLLRGYTSGKYSLIGSVSKYFALKYYSHTRKIDKAPKIFAARLGVVFSLLITVLSVVSVSAWGSVFALILIAFASIECFFNFCVGCYVYTLFIVPRLKSC